MARVTDDALRGQGADELTLGVRARVPIGHGVVHVVDVLVGEGVEVVPPVAARLSQHVQTVFARDAVGPAVLDRRSTVERDWFRDAFTAKADIGEPVGAIDGNDQYHVRTRQDAALCRAAYASFARPRLEAECRERKAEECVLLKTVAAAASGNEGRLERGGIQLDRPAQLDVEILERDGRVVGTMEARPAWTGRRGSVCGTPMRVRYAGRSNASDTGSSFERRMFSNVVATLLTEET